MVWFCFFLHVSRCGLGTGVVTLQRDRLWPVWLESLKKVHMGDAAVNQKPVSEGDRTACCHHSEVLCKSGA